MVDPDEAAFRLPEDLRPHVTADSTVVGCCLLEIEAIRPSGLPAVVGQHLRAAAHRISVEWEDESGTTVTGVYVPLRHTDSRLAVAFGGRLFLVAVFGIYLALLIVGPSPLLRVLGGFGVIVFGTVALIGIPSLVRSRTVLVTFTVDGIHATKGATIAWPNLESVRREGVRPRPAWPLRRFAAKSLVFVPGDIDLSLEGIVRLRRWRLRNAARVYGGPVVVARMTIAETFDEVLAAVGRHAGAAVLDGAP